MATRFVIGRAGAGKTEHCLSAMRDQLVASVDGPRLLLLVPEQAALQTERALITDPRVGSSHRGEVMGFARLADRILASTSQAGPKALTANGRAMTLRYLLARLSGQLQYYQRLERLNGFINQLARSVGELFEEAIEPDQLQAAAGACADDPMRAQKLADLHLIYQAYLDHLGGERLDPSQHLEAARRRANQVPWLRDAHIWVDGFAGFTRQETLLLSKIGSVVGAVEVTVMADPALAERLPRSLGELPSESVDLFAKTARAHARLCHDFREAGVTIGEPLLLRQTSSKRFGSGSALEEMERQLFSTRRPTAQVPEPSTSEEAAGTVGLIELSSRRAEVDYAVLQICNWVQRPRTPLRYRDIALIVRNLDPYHDLLGAALTQRNIPHFIDRRKPTTHHPLVELLRGLTVMVADAMSLSSVRPLLKTGLMGLDDEHADTLENFILAHNISGFDAWLGDDWKPLSDEARLPGPRKALQDPSQAEVAHLALINQARRQFIGKLSGWLSVAHDEQTLTADQWAKSLARALVDLDVAKQLESWAADAQEDGRPEEAEEHRQLWRDSVAFVEDLADALGDQRMNIHELASVIDAGLSQFTLGLAPPMLDQVMVGGIERSRHPEIKAAVILGFNDTAFPQVSSEGTILNDDDRLYLADQGLTVGTRRKQRILEEKLLVYVAFTRASDELLITYPLTDEQGNGLRPSPFAADLRAACPSLAETSIPDPTTTRATWPLMSSTDLAEALTREFRERPAIDEDPLASRSQWNDIYRAAIQDESLRSGLAVPLASLAFCNQAQLSPKSIEQMSPTPFQASVSRLERYAACPFQHFADYALRLQERETTVLQDNDLGTLHHAVLEDFMNGLVANGQRLADLDEVSVLERLDESSARMALRPALACSMSIAREAYLLRRQREDLGRVLSAQRHTASRGNFRPKDTEVPFGFKDDANSLPALELDTPAGRRLHLRGYIDRVDLAELSDELLGIVIDYKRSGQKKTLDLARAYNGLSLQLLGYLLVLARHGTTLAGRPIRPIGAFFVTLTSHYIPLEHPDEYLEATHDAKKRHYPRGLIDFDSVQALEAGFSSGKAECHQVEIKKAGGISRRNTSDAATHHEFNALLDRTRRELGRLADGILDGDIRVAPYRLKSFSPCSWCAYRSVCRFEFDRDDVRHLHPMGKDQVLDTVVQEQGNA